MKDEARSVSIDEIDLDTANPRIAHFLEHYEPPYTAEMIHLALQAGGDDEDRVGATFQKLRQSILRSGRIVQPVILQRRLGGRFRCVEGNTRVFLYREFRDKKLQGSWTHIPAIVHADLPESEVHAIRLQVHLVGPRRWDPYSKAKYLHRLRYNEQFTHAQIVDLCGGNERGIIESLGAYDDMETYYRPLVGDENFDVRKFSGFLELQKPNVKQALVDHGFTITDFARWIHDDENNQRIEKLQYVRRLPAILRDEKARKIFLVDGMEQALKVLDRPSFGEVLEQADLDQLARALRQAIDGIPYNLFSRLKQDPALPTVASLQEARDAVNGLLADLGLDTE